MLADHASSAIVAVGNLASAKSFYGGVLGLIAEKEDEQVVVYRTGPTRLVVYRSDHAGTNQANAVAWGVGDDLGAIVAALENANVPFERYDFGPDARMEGPVHLIDDARLVWFRDPDGNILHINNF